MDVISTILRYFSADGKMGQLAGICEIAHERRTQVRRFITFGLEHTGGLAPPALAPPALAPLFAIERL